MKWLDIGINLTNNRYQQDWRQVVDDGVQAGVSQMLVTGTSVQQSLQALNLARQRPGVLFATAGCHPHDAGSFEPDGFQQIKALAGQPQVVAVGECGLDFNRNFSPRDQQVRAFKQQLELAVVVGKPVFLHERDAFDCQYQILKDYMPRLKGAVAHCFTGSARQLESYLDLGLSIGITGWVCDERRGKPLWDILSLIPDKRLMLETDGPYLTPRDLKPKPKDSRNLPVYLPHIGQAVATARQQTQEEVARISYHNAVEFFGLKPLLINGNSGL